MNDLKEEKRVSSKENTSSFESGSVSHDCTQSRVP